MENDLDISIENIKILRTTQKHSSPRSLLNWSNSPNTKQIQKKMANRIHYLKHLHKNKHTLL